MKLYSKNELKDSRIFFDQRPPRFMLYFSLFVGIILITAFALASILVKPYIVKAQGIVNTTDNQFISVNVSGTIMDILVNEGDIVVEGQEIIKVSNGQESLQISAIEQQIQHAKDKLEIMNLYQKSLEEKKNTMRNEGLQQEYYGYVEYYLSQVESENHSVNQAKKSLEEQNEKQAKLLDEINDLRDKLSKEEVDNQNLEAEISTKESELTSIREEIKSLNDQVSTPSSQASQMYSQLIMELGKARTALNSQLVDLESNLEVYSGQYQTYSIVANNSGVVHYLMPITQGMSVQQNQVIAEISQQMQEQFLIEAYVNAYEISKIHLGDKVNVAVAGVNMTKYGTIEGKIVTIDSGTISQETANGNALLYRIRVEISDYELNSKRDQIQLIKSMPIEARIVYEEETYLEWILNLLSFKN